jgi:hypothetical protein
MLHHESLKPGDQETRREGKREDVPQVKAYGHIPSLSQISPKPLPPSHSPPHPQMDLIGIKPTTTVSRSILTSMMARHGVGLAKIRK